MKEQQKKKKQFCPLEPEIILPFSELGSRSTACLLPQSLSSTPGHWYQEGKPFLQGRQGDLGWQSILQRGNSSLHTSQGDGLSLGHLGTPSAPVS